MQSDDHHSDVLHGLYPVHVHYASSHRGQVVLEYA